MLTSIAPIKVVDIELSQPIPTFEHLEGYLKLQGLVRLHGTPLGYVYAPIECGRCTAQTLSKLILEHYSWAITCQLIKNGLFHRERPEELRLEDLIDLPPAPYEGEWPLVTVAVCTRDRPDDIALCLAALNQLDYPALDILIVDNAPTTDGTKDLVATQYPHVRYVREPRPGLDWARNRAILEAKGDILAYTDDDVVVDPGWVKALAQVFIENPDVMAVTGLVVPYELETEAQALFEFNGGFGRGFKQKWYRANPDQTMPWWLLGTGSLGTGANMAYRRNIFNLVGQFDPALDVGTVTNGGGDLEMFFRVIKEGYALVYEPKAIVHHRHRSSFEKLKTQITNNGIGLYSYFVCGAKAYPDERLNFIWIGLWWLVYWSIRRLWIAFKHPTRFPVELVLSEFKGSFIGLFRYQAACKQVAKIIQEFGKQTFENSNDENERLLNSQLDKSHQNIFYSSDKIAVRQVRLDQELQPLLDVQDYAITRVFFSWKEHVLANVDIENRYYPISRDRLLESLFQDSGITLIQKILQRNEADCWHYILNVLQRHYRIESQSPTAVLPKTVKVSINLATYDRPDDLRNCLRCLLNQKTERDVEIVVVDNHPESGLTPPVVAEFPGVKLVQEPRQGLAYARNAGFVASTGKIVIATDDDVTIPPDWLEKLVAPFSRQDVMIVTGNVLPLQLETPSQQFFEKYGGLGRGYESFKADGDWFESSPRFAIPTWRLGATANAAFRAFILSHPQIGLMDEALGPGMPSGVGEDTYLFYKTLKAGFTLIYEPSAYVWHKHRKEPSALRRQLYGYSKGHVSYNLTTWLKDGDWRGLLQILVGLPLYHTKQIGMWFLRRSDYPLSLTLLEIWGNLAGPWSLWRSHRRVRREGRSNPYIPMSQRSGIDASPNPELVLKSVESPLEQVTAP
ncbi:MAG TPA: glycosyltransferase [Crinalium sp.]|jgi:GT2 family glycosyltransferase